MPKKAGVRTFMDSQHVKRSETLLKSGTAEFLSYFLIIQKENQLKKVCLSSISNLESVC